MEVGKLGGSSITVWGHSSLRGAQGQEGKQKGGGTTKTRRQAKRSRASNPGLLHRVGTRRIESLGSLAWSFWNGVEDGQA